MKFRNLLAVSVLVQLFVAAISFAASTACPEEYLSGIAPDIVNARTSVKTRELCSSHFAVMHSGVTRTALWSAEYLTANNLAKAKGLPRTNDFHPDNRLPADERAELSDYSRSGYDRGHMSPNGDMPDPKSQSESFALSNMIPQNPNNNRNLWEGIESAVRTLCKQRGELYIITGPLFIGKTLNQLKGRVTVPTNIYKIVYDPQKHIGAAYVVENKEGNDYSVWSIAELEKYAGIDFFPKLSITEKQSKLDLPVPTPHGNH